jgi:Domain of unknown function (DUF4185)
MRLILLVGLVGGCGEDAAFSIASVEDVGNLQLPPGARGRDGGMLGELDGRLLWTFGDTFLTAPNRLDGSTMLSGTAAWATRDAPLDLDHVMDGDQPAQIIPYTDEELAANRADFLHGYAIWPEALFDASDGTALIPFDRVRRKASDGFETEAVGIATMRSGDTIAKREPELLFSAPDTLFIPQFVRDDFAYAFGCDHVGFLDFRCKLARAPKQRVTERAAWAFFDGHDWQTEITKAAYVIDRTAGGPSISYNAYLGRYLAVNCEIVSSTVLLRTADDIVGPWDDGVELEAGATGVLAPLADTNYACVEHPELASDGHSIVISYSRPTEPFVGEVRLARITFR